MDKDILGMLLIVTLPGVVLLLRGLYWLWKRYQLWGLMCTDFRPLREHTRQILAELHPRPADPATNPESLGERGVLPSPATRAGGRADSLPPHDPYFRA